MPPRKRTNAAANKEQQKKLAVFLTDFDKQRETRIQDIERHTRNLCKQVTSYYVQEICKLPKTTREMKLDDFLAGKDQAMTLSLGKIEEEINQGIQLPVFGKKPRTGTKAAPASTVRAVAKATPASALLPPAPPSKSTVRKKRVNTDPVDMEVVEEVVVKTERVVTQICLVPSTPVANGSSTAAINNKTFDFDDVSPENDLARTLKKQDVNENIPIPLKKNFTAASVCRKPVPNEILWSEHGSPVVIDPRAALKQSKVQAAISVNHGALTLTDSPMTDDTSKCPQLDPADIDKLKKLQAKMSRMIEISEHRVNDKNEPGSSSK